MSVAGSSDPLPGGAMDARVHDYLARVRKGLAGLSREAASEIVEELRSHILEKAAVNGEATPAAVEDVLAALGKPEELAAQYMADDLLERAASNRSPRLFLRGLVLWASLSAGGIFVLIGCVVGYFLGGAFMLCAILKPLHPQSAGLWRLPDEAHSYSLRLGFGSVPAGGTELLGWWMVPVGLLLGGGLCLLTTKCALWCARVYRRSHALGRG
ncbi:MAG: hypothetical protein WCC32_16995 [Terriglobales bacterium]